MIECITPNWPAPKTVRAYTTTRSGGKSTGTYSSFNLASHVKDNPDHVDENRQLLIEHLKLKEEPRWLTQTHSATVLNADNITNAPTADASFTSSPNVICAVLTGDCLPILLCNTSGSEVAAIHAGWRSQAGDIIKNTLDAMNTPAHELIAWLGPGISQTAYQVGPEFKAQFLEKNPENEVAFKTTDNGIYADLYLLARIELENLSIKSIYSDAFCTYTDTKRFYSARRDGTFTGRMATLIWITEN